MDGKIVGINSAKEPFHEPTGKKCTSDAYSVITKLSIHRDFVERTLVQEHFAALPLLSVWHYLMLGTLLLGFTLLSIKLIINILVRCGKRCCC